MATTVTVSSNYAGKVAGQIIGAAFKEGDTLSKNVLTLAPNVNYKFNLRKIAYTDGTVDYSCGHVPAGAIVLSEKVIAPKKVKNDFDVCKEDFRQTWDEDQIGASASNPNAPSTIMEAIQLEILSSQAELVDAQIWSGLNATNGEIGDGFLVQFAADGDIIKANNGITAIGAATTEANVEANLKAALAAIPVSVSRYSHKSSSSLPTPLPKYQPLFNLIFCALTSSWLLLNSEIVFLQIHFSKRCTYI